MQGAELNTIIVENVWVFVKIGILFSLLFYLGFSLMIIRQAQLMTKTVAGELDRKIHIISWAHFIFTALVFLGVVVFI